MKNYKQILEAVHRGIQLALDDYEDIEDNNSISQNSDIIKSEDYIGDRHKLNELIHKFLSQIGQLNVIFVSKQDLKDIAELSKQLGIKHKVINHDILIKIIQTTCRIDQFANLNWLDVSNITSFDNLFNQTLFDGDISEWDTHNVISMYSTFAFSNFTKDISNWDVSNVENMDWMFEDSIFNKPIGNWNVSKVKSMNGMFSKAQKFNQDISKWDVKNCAYHENFCVNSHLKQINRPNFWK